MKPEEIVNLLDVQVKAMEQKIKEYKQISNSMKAIKASISEALSMKQDVPFISDEKEQYYYSYPLVSRTMEEQELNFRKAALMDGEKESQVYSIFGTSTLADEYFKNGIIVNPEIRSFVSAVKDKDVLIQPSGRYACIIFDDNVNNKENYYECLADFIRKEKLQTKGNFVEEWIIPRVQNGMESTLIKIKIEILP